MRSPSLKVMRAHNLLARGVFRSTAIRYVMGKQEGQYVCSGIKDGAD